MRSFVFFLLLSQCVISVGCTDRPAADSKAFGRVLKELPAFDEAEKPFDFPYSDGDDHSGCEEDFKNDKDFF